MGKYKNSVVNVSLNDILTQEQIDDLFNNTNVTTGKLVNLLNEPEKGKYIKSILHKSPNLINLLIDVNLLYGQGDEGNIYLPTTYKIGLNSSSVQDWKGVSETPPTYHYQYQFDGLSRVNIDEVSDVRFIFHIEIQLYKDNGFEAFTFAINRKRFAV